VLQTRDTHVVDGGKVTSPAAKAGRKTKMGDEEERPWKCCDRPVCPKTFPPFCICADEIEQCDDCKDCQEAEDDTSLYVCHDRYQGDNPGPKCTEDAAAVGAR
jgi:hypothetical protein